MADNNEHRRVEPRGAVVGTGMLTDPERIQSLQAEKARKERAWRAPPKHAFGEVMDHTPKKRFERVGVYTPSDERIAKSGEEPPENRRPAPEDVKDVPQNPPRDAGEDAPAVPAEISGLLAAPGEGAPAAKSGEEAPSAAEPPRRSALPPDPRMASVQRALDEKLAAAGARSRSGQGAPAPSAPRGRRPA